MHKPRTIKRALISVSDKHGIVEFAQKLASYNIEILSTGGTAKLLKEHQVNVTEIENYTGFPEMMDGRLKTLHPKIYGGILGRRDQDLETMANHDLPGIDLVVVNLYPFQTTIARPDVSLESAIENIDIGGPTMIRAAAKNFAWCTVVTDANDYSKIIDELETQQGALSYQSRITFAKKAFSHTAQYDGIISNYFTSLNQDEKTETFSSVLNLQYELKEILRYGENPHQQAALYLNPSHKRGLATTTQLQGKPLSYNNILDSQAALTLINNLKQAGCVIVKHTNPCGVALGENALHAYQHAFQADRQSAFGGIIAFNQVVDEQTMQYILNNQFVEIILAPAFSAIALEIAQTKPNCRLLSYLPNQTDGKTQWDLRSIDGGVLVQSNVMIPDQHFEIVTQQQLSPELLIDLNFAWDICKSVKSNAIVLAKNGQTLGIGAGQTSRVFSLEIACLRAKQNNLSLQGAVLASDAFFPFKDNVELAHQAGITAIIQPGGSQRDAEVIETANALGIAMVFTKTRYFLH